MLATPRWVGWTLLAVVAVIVCGGMAYWQLIRAESPGGSLLNAGYALQWPLFGVFFAALWWRMLRAEARHLAVIRGEVADPVAADDPSGSLAASEDIAAPGSSAAGTSRDAVLGSASPPGPLARPRTPATSPGSSAAAGPFTPRPAGVRPGDGQGAPVRGRARTDYNAMLAALARSDADAADETR